MITKIRAVADNRILVTVIKILFCVLIVVWFFNCVYEKDLDSYFSYRDYSYRNEFSEIVAAEGTSCIEQHFISRGNVLSNISLYFAEVCDAELQIEIMDEDHKIICSKMVHVSDFDVNEWSRISVNCDNLKRNGSYFISLKGDNLSYIILSEANADTEIFTECNIDGHAVPYTLALGLQITYRYMTPGRGLELMISLLFAAALMGMLCYTVFHIEKVYVCFVNTEKKEGFLYALYFSVYTVLLFNPLAAIRNEVTEFNRVIGSGLIVGVDASKRNSNFIHWFVYLIIAFILYFFLANYFKSKELSEENHKAALLLDNVIVIANLVLGLRCISYFYNEAKKSPVFYYADFMIMAIIFFSLAYIALRLEKKISVENYEALLVSGWMLALPVSVIVIREWSSGRGLMGCQILISIAIIFIIKLAKTDWNKAWISSGINSTAVCMSLIPFCTSFYIEFIIWLNQRGTFWTHIRRYYFYAIMIGVFFTAIVVFTMIKMKKELFRWKSFAYPLIVFGFVCLWKQIPIEAEYSADIFETANSSILINDVLNFGDIPIIQHYGGHMMQGVWEGLIYAFLNKDNAGAVLSPYAGYIATVISVLFFFLIKYIWDEDSAVIVTLFFPFYSSVDKWGLGLLMVLAVGAYVRKNTYLRAILFWLACIWCTLYRLDLGFAFVMACMSVLLIYIITEKNVRAFKQLAITLAGWGIVGLGIWFGGCIIKDVNPVKRLLEFMFIGLSNQNWAYQIIGDPSLAKFAWAYMFIPFSVALCSLYIIFSKKIRHNTEKSIWAMTLAMGFSYFYNFSRGLVRHSLAEGKLVITVWCAYLFLAVFAAILFCNKKLVVPVFAGFVLFHALLQDDSVFLENGIAADAVDHIGTSTETWTLSRFAEEEVKDNEKPKRYWEHLLESQEVIERVKWTPNLKKSVENYRVMIDGLLNEGETFVDFINKTTIYSLINRQNPAYVSQSPLQLSGEFTQEQFIEEIEGVPIVLMPYDENNSFLSEALDDVPNSYRYYKVSEYIYQNYVPLCTYENTYAIWCLPERYDEMAEKVRELMAIGTEMNAAIVSAEGLQFDSVEMINNNDGSFSLNAIGTEPGMGEIQNAVDLTPYTDRDLSIAVDYETDTLGDMQLYYTTDEEEDYEKENVSIFTLKENKGRAYFKIPITECMRIKLDIPEGSSIKIKSFKVGICNCKLADYGYDGPYLQEDGENYSYLPYLHNYTLSKLPIIWAEGDSENSADNKVITSLQHMDGVYRYDMESSSYRAEGNYLKVSMDYIGRDRFGKLNSDDETADATIKIGKMINDKFETKYIYSFTVEEGQHDYMFRISNDYYWYSDETNAVKLECDEQLLNVNMEILEGD